MTQVNILSLISCTEILRPPRRVAAKFPYSALLITINTLPRRNIIATFCLATNHGRGAPRGISSRPKSGRVGIGIEGGLLDFLKNWDRVEITVLEFPGQNREKSRFSSTFPVIFRSKTPGKIGISPTFPNFLRFFPTSLDFSRLTSTILRVREGQSRPDPTFEKSRDGKSRPDPTFRKSRDGPPRLISPIVGVYPTFTLKAIKTHQQMLLQKVETNPML